jgi:phage terminase large subunit-like protein
MSSNYGHYDPDDPCRPVAVETHPTHCPNGHSWRGRGLFYVGWCTTGRAEWDDVPPHRFWFCKTCEAEVHHDGVTRLCAVMRLCDANGVTTANPALDNPEFYNRPDRS